MVNNLRDRLTNSLGISEIRDICRSVAYDREAVEQIFDLFHDADRRVAGNAAWVATHLDAEAVVSAQSRQNELITLAMQATDNVTLQRLTLNILEKQTFTFDNLRADFLDFCFEQMMSASATNGIRSLCIKLAYFQCVTNNELLRELAHYIDLLTQTDLPPALQCAVRKVKLKMPRHF